VKIESYKLIILHGWKHDKSKWDGFIQYFKPDEVIVFDLPGFGEEKLVDNNWGIPEYSAWVKKKIEALGESNIILLGHSFGGRIAGSIASENPAWLKGLILYGSPLLYRPAATIRIKIKIAKLLKGLGFSKTNEDMMYPIFKRVVTFDETKLLPKITVPTLLLWGENDMEVPVSIAEEAHALVQGSQLIIMQEVGHNAHLDSPNLFCGIIKKFINDL
jgi:pimeloyl-ACP methyl ester carboxylesterase